MPPKLTMVPCACGCGELSKYGRYKHNHWIERKRVFANCLVCGKKLESTASRPRKICGTKKCRAEYRRALWGNENYKKRVSRLIKRAQGRPDAKENMSLAKKKNWRNPEYREKITRVNIEKWDRDGYREFAVWRMRE